MKRKLFILLSVTVIGLSACVVPGSMAGNVSAPAAAGVAGPNLSMIGTPFMTPVRCQSSFNTDSAWLICEPGSKGDDTTAWTIGETAVPYHQNTPEGAFAFFSLASGDIAIDGVTLHLPGATGLNYLVVLRGRIDDNIVDSDLNETAVVTNFVPGHGIWGYLPKGAYVSKDWFRQQMVAATTQNFTNCGAEGCSHLKIVLFDVSSHKYQLFSVQAGSLDTWTLIEQNH